MDKEIAIPSKTTRFMYPYELGDIIQCEVSIEGRLIITLQRDRSTLKIWYNDKEDQEKKQENEQNHLGLSKRGSHSPYQVKVVLFNAL